MRGPYNTRGHYLAALPDDAEFGMNGALEFQPQALLNIDRAALQRGREIGVLPVNRLAEAGVHQSGAVLKSALQVGYAAQELDLVLGQLEFPSGAPLGPMFADVRHLRVHHLDLLAEAFPGRLDVLADPFLGRLNVPAEAFLGRLNVLSEAFLCGPQTLLPRPNPVANLDQSAVVLTELSNGPPDPSQPRAVESPLPGAGPTEHASHQ